MVTSLIWKLLIQRMVTLFTGNSIGEHLDYYIDDNFDKNNGALLKW